MDNKNLILKIGYCYHLMLWLALVITLPEPHENVDLLVDDVDGQNA